VLSSVSNLAKQRYEKFLQITWLALTKRKLTLHCSKVGIAESARIGASSGMDLAETLNRSSAVNPKSQKHKV
jgi:hypothetical protein